ncbi:MAG: TSUP family transporter [Granulosicoccus sp.]
MLESLQNLLQLTQTEIVITFAVVFIAGIVRGFSGFALSALVMAGLALIIPPSGLFAICLILEACAGLLMIKGGFQNADMRIAWGLALGGMLGTPIGLYVTASVPADISRMLALLLIMALAILQLFRKSPAFLASTPGLYISGVATGFATGIASVGGMVVALYVLAQNAPAARMRATLVMYLFLNLFAWSGWLLLGGFMDQLAITRALALAPVALVGIFLGTLLFRPSLETFYKRFCLVLLMGLAAQGLIRLVPNFW